MTKSLEEWIKLAKERQVEVLEGEPEEGQWYRIPVPGAVCAGGSPYWGYLRKGTEPNLIVFFSGGGVSINEYTAARPNRLGETGETFYSSEDTMPINDLILGIGIFNDEPDNPFRNWSHIFVSYSTGDFHVGNGDYHYASPDGSPAVLHHHGYRNYRGLMDQAVKYLSPPAKLLITGASAGAFGASALASDVMSYFPDCHDVTCCPDSSLLLYDQWQSVARNIWQAEERIWKPLHSFDICLDWMRNLYAEKGNNIKYLYTCSIRDAMLAQYQHFIDYGTLELTREQCLQFEKDLKGMIDVLKAELPGIGLFLTDSPAAGMAPEVPGTQHTRILDFNFPISDIHGTSLRDWMWSGVNGTVYDVGLELLNREES